MKEFKYNADNRAILVDKKVVIEPDLLKWAAWFETSDRRVAYTILNRRKGIYVSTVFLGLDHGFQGPLWFETMIFGTSLNDSQWRYATWEEAMRGHAEMVRRARQARQVRKKRIDFKRTIKQMGKTLTRLAKACKN